MKNPGIRDLPQRLGISLLLSLVVGTLILFAHNVILKWFFAGAVASLAAVGLWEYYQFLRCKGLFPPVVLGMILTVLYVMTIFYRTQFPSWGWVPLWYRAPEIVLGCSFFVCFAYYAFRSLPAIIHVATAFLGIVYLAIPCGMILYIMYFFPSVGGPKSEGTWWIIYLLAVTKSADMGGYFFGRLLGRWKLAPRISPHKTIEGGLGGLGAAVAMSVLIVFFAHRYGHVLLPITPWIAIGLGLMVGILGQLGDLAESLLKRDAGVKDSNQIPGIGGGLDMVDSLLFTTPVVYIVIRILYTPFTL